jgi:hypothetical protein
MASLICLVGFLYFYRKYSLPVASYLEPNFHGLLDLFGEFSIALHPDLDVVLLVIVGTTKVVLPKEYNF